MNDSINHVRVNDTFLTPLERPVLHWLAAHSPAWMTPDKYTAIGVLGGVIILIGYLLSGYHPGFFWLATFGFILNWFGDSLDGTLARFRHIERPVYGFYIDHVLDSVTQILVFVGLGLSPYVTFNVACLTLVAYLLLSVLAYVRTCVRSEFRISYGKLGPTDARVLAILLNTAMFFFREQLWPLKAGNFGMLYINPYDLYVSAIGLLLLAFFLTTASQEAIQLAKENR